MLNFHGTSSLRGLVYKEHYCHCHVDSLLKRKPHCFDYPAPNLYWKYNQNYFNNQNPSENILLFNGLVLRVQVYTPLIGPNLNNIKIQCANLFFEMKKRFQNKINRKRFRSWSEKTVLLTYWILTLSILNCY